MRPPNGGHDSAALVLSNARFRRPIGKFLHRKTARVMVPTFEQTLDTAVRHVLLVVTMRMCPFACVSIFESVLPPIRRSCILLVYGLVVAAVFAYGAQTNLKWVVVGFSYFVVAALAALPLRNLLDRGRITRGAAFAFLSFIFLVLPGVLFAGRAMLFLVVGWDLVLSSYSYCIDTTLGRRPKGTVTDYMRFLFVNPALVYSKKGQRVGIEQRPLIGPLRAVFGVALLLMHSVCNQVLARKGMEAGMAGGAVIAIAAVGGARVLSFHAAHSGLAHLQIGLMRVIGWELPERYDYPLLARTPADFWRRWNTYVRSWLEAYVFLPVARGIARRSRSPWLPAIAVLVTLASSGLLHDALTMSGRQILTLRYTAIYFAAAVVWLVWVIVARLWSLFRQSGSTTLYRWIEKCGVVASHVALLSLLIVAALKFK